MGRHPKLRPERKLIKCVCGHCDQMIWNYDKYWIKREYVHGHSTKGIKLERISNTCLCGCGAIVISFGKHIRKYICGHQSKNKKFPEWGIRQLGKNNPNWKDGIVYDGNGYRLRRTIGHPRAKKKGHYVWEHVLVMEAWLSERLGHQIYLTTEFHVHHRNHVKDDNRIENLCLMTNTDHIGHHNKLRVGHESYSDKQIDNLKYYLEHV